MTGHLRIQTCLLAGVALLCGASATSAAVVLDFEGLEPGEFIQDYYNGGFGSFGSGPGPNFGITFGDDALICLDADAGGNCNSANEPSPESGVIFLTGPGVVMNVPGGFDTGFSFFYSAVYGGSVGVYDDLDGTGNLLGTLDLAENLSQCTAGGDPSGNYACWTAIGVAFAGIAKSVNFSGSANFIIFDDITLGSVTPGDGDEVPEPATLLLFGSGLAVAHRRLRNRRSVHVQS